MLHDAVPTVPADEKSLKVQIGLLGLEAIVQVPDPLPNLIEKAGRVKNRCAGFCD
jgi:hypothetical protein